MHRVILGLVEQHPATQPDSELRIEAYVADRATESQLAKQQLPWHDVALSTDPWVALKPELVHHTPVDGLLPLCLPLHLD